MSLESSCRPNTFCKQSWQGPAPLQNDSYPGERRRQLHTPVHPQSLQPNLRAGCSETALPISVTIALAHRLEAHEVWLLARSTHGSLSGDKAGRVGYVEISVMTAPTETGGKHVVWLLAPSTNESLSDDNTRQCPVVQCACSPYRQDEGKHPVWLLILPN